MKVKTKPKLPHVLSDFIDVYVPAKDFMDIQTQILGRVDVDTWTSVEFLF
jgi:hypothetical protein